MGLFGRTKELEAKIDDFCDKVSQGAMVFRKAVQMYMGGDPAGLEERLSQISQLESQGDTLRREIEHRLYAEMLMPDIRGDVLGLLENMDNVLNACEGTLWAFSIEKPGIPEGLRREYLNLADSVLESVEALVTAARAFFRDARHVSDHLHKVLFYEKEADKASTQLKRAIFGGELHLSEKNQLRNFVDLIDNIANTAEDVADRLAIYAIKRSL